MFKSVSITAALVLASISGTAIAAPAPTTFVHDGQTYTYTVEHKANSRVIRGTVGSAAEPFVLYVSAKKVSGTVNGRPVSFARSEVKPVAKEVLVASR
jgi:hypothetical protein